MRREEVREGGTLAGVGVGACGAFLGTDITTMDKGFSQWTMAFASFAFDTSSF